MIAAPTLLHCTVGQACHQVVHFLFGADIVGFVQKVLLLLFGQMGIAAVFADSAKPKPTGT